MGEIGASEHMIVIIPNKDTALEVFLKIMTIKCMQMPELGLIQLSGGFGRVDVIIRQLPKYMIFVS